MESEESKAPEGSEELHHPTSGEGASRVNVLLAVDDDEPSERAVYWALNHLVGSCFGFSILHAYNYAVVLAGAPVVGVPYAYGALHQMTPWQRADSKAVREEAEHQARALLRKYSAIFKEGGRPLLTAVARRGSAKDVIIAYLEQHPADLLLVGSRGLNGLTKWMTSVSYFCLYNAPCSTLVVKSCSKLPNTGSRKVVVCLDRCTPSEKAFKWTRDNFVQPGDEVVLVSACSSDKEEPKTGEDKTSLDAQVQEYLGNFAEEVHQVTRQKCDVMVLSGDPRNVIVGVVDKGTKEPTVDLLVMGSRGLGLLKRTLLGSVVDHCAAQTCVPILVVK